jgi:hypothetical protein
MITSLLRVEVVCGYPGVELEPKGVERHGQQGVGADREDQVHQLPVVELGGQGLVGLVAETGVIEKLVHRVDQQRHDAGPGPGIDAGTPGGATELGNLRVGNPGPPGDRLVLRPLVATAPPPGHPQHDQLPGPPVHRRGAAGQLPVVRQEGPRQRRVVGEQPEHVDRRRLHARGAVGEGIQVPRVVGDRGEPAHVFRPPFTPRIWPVMYPASSEIRNAQG